MFHFFRELCIHNHVVSSSRSGDGDNNSSMLFSSMDRDIVSALSKELRLCENS